MAASSAALRMDRPGVARAAALTAGVYIPGRPSVYFPQRRSAPREQRPPHWLGPVGRHRQAVRAVAPRLVEASSFLPNCIFALKLIAAVLGSATATLAYLNYEASTKNPPQAAPVVTAAGQSTLYRTAADAERGVPLNYPRAVKTVSFTAPAQSTAHITSPVQPIANLAPPAQSPVRSAAPAQPTLRSVPPVQQSARTAPPAQPVLAPVQPPQQMAALPPSTNRPAPASPAANPLSGKPLRYLIGGGAGQGRDGEVTMVGYSVNSPVKSGISIAYCNLFDELNTRKYGPYLHTSDTAAQYGEGQIDPRGPGWEKNLREQYERRRKAGFEYVELDNPDAYKVKDVIGAIELAATYNLKVIAKNPGITDDPVRYVAHPNVHGIIVEKGAGGAHDMETLRKKAGKPTIPVWFVAFGNGRGWASTVAATAKNYYGMGVTYSSAGEYGNALDVLVPSNETRAAQVRS